MGSTAEVSKEAPGSDTLAAKPAGGDTAAAKVVIENAPGKPLATVTDKQKDELVANKTLPVFKIDVPPLVQLESAKIAGQTAAGADLPAVAPVAEAKVAAGVPVADARVPPGAAGADTKVAAGADAKVAAGDQGADAKVAAGVAEAGSAAARFAAAKPDVDQYPVVAAAVSEAKAALADPLGPNRKTVDHDNREGNARADEAKAIIAKAVFDAAKAGKDEGTRLAAAGKPDPAAQDKSVKSVVEALQHSVLGGGWRPVVTKTEDGKYVVNLDNGQPKEGGKNLVGEPYVVSPEDGTHDKASAPGPTADRSGVPKPEAGEVAKSKDSGDILDESGVSKAKPAGERKPEDEIQAATSRGPEKQTPVQLTMNDADKVDRFIDKYQDGDPKKPEDKPKPLSPEDKTAVKAAVLAVQSADVGYLATIVPNGSNAMNPETQAAFKKIMTEQGTKVDFHEDKANQYSSMLIHGWEGSVMIENNGGVPALNGIDGKGQIMGSDQSDKSDKERQSALLRAAKGIALTATVADPNEWSW